MQKHTRKSLIDEIPSTDFQHEVYRIRLKGRVGLPETIERLNPAGYFLQPMIDRNGSAVVFWGREAGEAGFNIWRWDGSGRGPVKLTNMQAVSGHPFWSADANHILFFSTGGLSSETEWSMATHFNLGRSPRNIWMMEGNGEGRRKLTDGPHVDERPCISPDGKSVVFVSDRSGAMNLWSVSTETGELSQITKHKGLDYRPIFSPDGDWLAFFTTNSPRGTHELCVMRWPDGKLSFPVPSDLFGWVHGPFWLADGKSLLVHALKTCDDVCSLWIINSQSHHIEQLELPGVAYCGHGTLDAEESFLAFDSPAILVPSVRE